MDFLKYLDVMIGLAIVMILLSPLVTAFTQLWMWLFNARSTFLLQSLQRIILQLDANPAAIIKIEKAGAPVRGATLDPFGTTTTDAAGELWLPNGVGDHRKPGKPLEVTVRSGGTALPDATLQTTLLPQRSRDSVKVVSLATDAAGKTEIAYTHDGAPEHASSTAQFEVRDTHGASVNATVHCLVDKVPLDVKVVAGSVGSFVHPAGSNAPGSYKIECSVTAGGAAAVGFVVHASFARNTRFDRQFTSGPTSVDGKVSLPIAIVTEDLALDLASAVVAHPMLARTVLKGPWTRIPPFRNRNAEVVEREELIRILLEIASGEGAGAANLEPVRREALRQLLAANGISSARESLARVRAASQQLEKEEPQLASHVRHAKALIEGAQSDFVGKINQWFDANMARATQQYAAVARMLTVVGAFIVALLLQLNSVDLLQRLAADGKLRDALVVEAKNHADRIDKLAAAAPQTVAAGQGPRTGESNQAGSSDDLQLARAQYQEIQQNLALLRKPELAIIPDHFVWQRVPRAQLVRNPLWKGPYPASLELLAGGSSYIVKPVWRHDPLEDLEAAIKVSGAPVQTRIEQGAEYVLLRSDEPLQLGFQPEKPKEPETIREIVRVAYATLSVPHAAKVLGASRDVEMARVQLVLDQHPVQLVRKDTPPALKTATRETLAPKLAALLRLASTSLAVACRDAKDQPADCHAAEYLIVQARDSSVKDIQLRADPTDPYSNVLGRVERAPRAWLVSANAVSNTTIVPARLPAQTQAPRAAALLRIQACDEAPTPAAAGGAEPVDLAVDAGGTRVRLAPCAPPVQKNKTAAVEQATRPIVGEAEVKGESRASAQSAPQESWKDENAPDPRASLQLAATSFRDDRLVIIARRLGTIELRHQPGKAETNVLDRHLDQVYEDRSVDTRSLAGIALTWALLSLGAPFWFDALKNLLKLRPAPAAAEQQNREERLKDTAKK